MEKKSENSDSDDTLDKEPKVEVSEHIDDYNYALELARQQQLLENRERLTLDKETEIEASENSDDYNYALKIAREQQLLEKREQLKLNLEKTKKKVNDLMKLIVANEETCPNLPSNMEDSFIPIDSQISMPQNLFQNALQNLRPIHPPLMPETTNVINKIVEEMNEGGRVSGDSPPDSLHYESEDVIRLEESYEGKGKEAKNPNFRYVKRAKPEVSATEESSQNIPAKSFKKAETSIQELQSSKSIDNRNSSSVKRKESHLEESCDRTSKLSENPAENTNLTKKLKSTDCVSAQYPTITGYLLKKKSEIFESSKCIDPMQTHQSSGESEQLDVPSTSGIKVIGCASTSKESPMFCDNDERLHNEREMSILTSNNEDGPQKEKIYPALLKSLNLPGVEMKIQSQTDKICSEQEALVVPSSSGIKAINCASSSKESSMLSDHDDRPHSEREMSPLTSDFDEKLCSFKRDIIMKFMTYLPGSNVEDTCPHNIEDIEDVYINVVGDDSSSNDKS